MLKIFLDLNNKTCCLSPILTHLSRCYCLLNYLVVNLCFSWGIFHERLTKTAMKLVEIKYENNTNSQACIIFVCALYSLFNKHIIKLSLAFIFLFVLVSANAQKDYTISTQPALLNTIPLGTLGASDKPEFVASSSVISFSVPTAAGAGAGFVEWMVLGGRIAGGSTDTHTGHQASYLNKNNAASDTKSTIRITWEVRN